VVDPQGQALAWIKETADALKSLKMTDGSFLNELERNLSVRSYACLYSQL